MTNRKRHLTARIKPATKHALMAQLALAADEIEALRLVLNDAKQAAIVRLHGEFNHAMYYAGLPKPRPLWRRLLGLR